MEAEVINICLFSGKINFQHDIAKPSSRKYCQRKISQVWFGSSTSWGRSCTVWLTLIPLIEQWMKKVWRMKKVWKREYILDPTFSTVVELFSNANYIKLETICLSLETDNIGDLLQIWQLIRFRSNFSLIISQMQSCNLLLG